LLNTPISVHGPIQPSRKIAIVRRRKARNSSPLASYRQSINATIALNVGHRAPYIRCSSSNTSSPCDLLNSSLASPFSLCPSTEHHQQARRGIPPCPRLQLGPSGKKEGSFINQPVRANSASPPPPLTTPSPHINREWRPAQSNWPPANWPFSDPDDALVRPPRITPSRKPASMEPATQANSSMSCWSPRPSEL